jgi:metacaspase-1
MSKRRSLHIGLNFVDPDKYNGWDGALNGCINDANAMRDIAVSKGFVPQQLIDDQATAENVQTHLNELAADLDDGDFLFLTYSGHGGQVPDVSGDEEDAYDETWCLYDTQLVDDTLYGVLCAFKTGVRIFVLSDSCHSETVTRAPFIDWRQRRLEARADSGPRSKLAPLKVTVDEFENHPEAYQAQRKWWRARPAMPKDSEAKVVLISGCEDDQTSMDGDVNGAFTEAFLRIWDNGSFQGNYSELREAVVKSIRSSQIPGIFSYGRGVTDMLAQTPLGD